MLLDEIEREPVAAGRARREHARLELHLLAGLHDAGQRCARAVPDDRVPERIEPVVRDLHSLAAARLPRRRAGIREPQARVRSRPGPRLAELVREPAHGKRAGRHGMLPDLLHFEG